MEDKKAILKFKKGIFKDRSEIFDDQLRIALKEQAHEIFEELEKKRDKLQKWLDAHKEDMCYWHTHTAVNILNDFIDKHKSRYLEP